MVHGREEAIKRLYWEVDRLKPATYLRPENRRKLQNDLIRKHGLDEPDSKIPGSRKPISQAQFDSMLRQRICVSMKKEYKSLNYTKVDIFFIFGTECLDNAGLQRLKYERPKSKDQWRTAEQRRIAGEAALAKARPAKKCKAKAKTASGGQTPSVTSTAVQASKSETTIEQPVQAAASRNEQPGPIPEDSTSGPEGAVVKARDPTTTGSLENPSEVATQSENGSIIDAEESHGTPKAQEWDAGEPMDVDGEEPQSIESAAGTTPPTTLPLLQGVLPVVGVTQSDRLASTTSETAPEGSEIRQSSFLERAELVETSAASKASQIASMPESAPPIEGPVDPTRLRRIGVNTLGGDRIAQALTELWYSVQNQGMQVLQEAGVESIALPALPLHPREDLEKLYLTMFGSAWPARMHELRSIGHLNAGDCLIGLLAAAVYEWVFTKPTPWNGPLQIMQALKNLHQVGAADGSSGKEEEEMIERGIWLRCFGKIDDSEAFQQAILRPTAAALGEQLRTAIHPLLIAQRYLDGGSKVEDPLCAEALEEVAALFESALSLKGHVAAAPDIYSWRWVDSGAEVDRTKMSDILQGSGNREVTFCVSPLVIRHGLLGRPDEVVSKARIFTREGSSKPFRVKAAP